MEEYSEVKKICDEQYKWIVDTTSVPPPNATNKALKEGRSAESVAADLSSYARRFPNPPAGYEDQTTDGVWAYKLYHCYGAGSHYPETNANIALGFSRADPPLPSVPPAHTAEDAWEIALQGWYRQGTTRFLDVENVPADKAELERRLAFAEILPLSWQGVTHGLYRYFIVTGMVPSVPRPYGVGQTELPKTWHGFTLQQYLDNCWATDQMLPAPWGPGGIPQ